MQADDFRGSDYVHRIWFFDKDNRKIQLHNPTGKKESGPTFKIGEDEELIGVYGVMNKRNYLTSLGFLLKKAYS